MPGSDFLEKQEVTYKSPNPHADNRSANFTENMNLKLYKQPLRCNKQQCVEVKLTLVCLLSVALLNRQETPSS